MEEFTLSLTRFRVIYQNNGADMAVEALRSAIQKIAPSVPIQLEFNGPNRENDRVASLSFVRAAILRPSTYGEVEPNLLTCGIGRNDDVAKSKLFNALINPQSGLPSPEVVVEIDGDEGLKAYTKIVSPVGLVVGSFKNPAAFITFDI